MSPRPSRLPAPRVPAPTEHAEQVLVMRWADLLTPRQPDLALLFAVPNGGARHPAIAAKLKREGVKPGVPDLVLPVARGEYFGAFIELKRERGGSVKPAQRAWHEALRERGYFVAVCRGAEDAQSVLSQYLSLPPAALRAAVTTHPRPARGTA